MIAKKEGRPAQTAQTDNVRHNISGGASPVKRKIPKKLPWWCWRRWEQRRRTKLDKLLLLSSREDRVKIQATRRDDGGRLRREVEAL